MREMMQDTLGLPVFIDNDVNAAILAEHRFGAAMGTQNAVMISLGIWSFIVLWAFQLGMPQHDSIVGLHQEYRSNILLKHKNHRIALVP